MNICAVLISIKPTAASFICMQHPGTIAGRNTGGHEERDGLLRGWQQRYQKKSFLSTGHPLIIHSLSGVSLFAIGPQIAMKCNLDLISFDCLREKDAARPARAWGGFDECLVRHLTMGNQRENHLWRQVGAMHGLQKNNCYPFKSHF